MHMKGYSLRLDEIGESLIGMNYTEACKKYNEYKIRLYYKNGLPMIITHDFKTNRINVSTHNDIIIEYHGVG